MARCVVHNLYKIKPLSNYSECFDEYEALLFNLEHMCSSHNHLMLEMQYDFVYKRLILIHEFLKKQILMEESNNEKSN